MPKGGWKLQVTGMVAADSWGGDLRMRPARKWVGLHTAGGLSCEQPGERPASSWGAARDRHAGTWVRPALPIGPTPSARAAPRPGRWSSLLAKCVSHGPPSVSGHPVASLHSSCAPGMPPLLSSSGGLCLLWRPGLGRGQSLLLGVPTPSFTCEFQPHFVRRAIAQILLLHLPSLPPPQ